MYVGGEQFPRVMQDGRDGDEEIGYVGRIQNFATAGFKYFDCKGVTEFRLTTRGYADGIFEVKTAWDGEVLAEIKIEFTNVWETYSAPIAIPDGVHAIYLTYKGNGLTALKSFELV
jgi:hypothetical protein